MCSARYRFRSASQSRRSAKGFTLLELLVTISVTLFLVTIAVPGYQNMMASNRLASDYNEVLSGLNYARSEAIKRRMPVTFKIENPASWSYEVRTTAGSEVLKMRRGNDESVNLSTLEVRFDQLGRIDDDATSCTSGCSVTLTHETAGNKVIDISRFGRVGRG